jgi:hypothetical protein
MTREAMRSIGVFALFVTVLVGRVTAHEVKYEGTVVVVEVNRFAASDGILARLEVKVSERGRTMIFDITHHTKLWRGNNSVTFAAARIQNGEPVEVTFSDEEEEKGALEVRLQARQ